MNRVVDIFSSAFFPPGVPSFFGFRTFCWAASYTVQFAGRHAARHVMHVRFAVCQNVRNPKKTARRRAAKKCNNNFQLNSR
jgi:hypothetical protein